VNRNILKLIGKLTLTGVALFVVFRKIEIEETLCVIQSADWMYLLLAFLLFLLSKVFSSFRLNHFFRDLGLHIPPVENLKLYGIGMFYNLFLPGGIGGDGYKVYLLNKLYRTPIRQLFAAVFLDRVNGLGVLIFLMFGLLILVEGSFPFDVRVWGTMGLLLVPLAFYACLRFFFKQFMASMAITVFYSFLVQILQLVCSYFILLGLGITSPMMEYLFVFLLSSIVAVLPLTIGGVGARELVFIFSHEYLGIDKNSAVAFSLLFFVITAVTSLTGIFLKFKSEKAP
jgi:uncharacterized membrane protein YbhN (UPF0104 family)